MPFSGPRSDSSEKLFPLIPLTEQLSESPISGAAEVLVDLLNKKNNKILVEFGMKYSNYVKSCLREKEREDKQRVLQLQREDRQRELQLQKEKELARKKQTEYLNELLIELNEGKSPRKEQYFIDK
jgi:hypothetical protein